MRRSALWTIVVCVCLAACGDDKPPALFAPNDDAGDLDASAGSGGDSGVAGQDGGAGDGGVLTGDVCDVSVNGLSCQVKQVTAGTHSTCALFNDGRVKCWGRWGGTVGDGPGEMGDDLPFLEFGAPIVEIAAGRSELAALDADGRVHTILYVTDGLTRQATVAFADVDDVVALGGPTCALLRSGRVKCWRWLSDWPAGFTFLVTVPVVASVMDGFIVEDVRQAPLGAGVGFSLAADALFTPFNTCVLNGAGQAQCWGDNAAGQLGEGSSIRVPATDLPLIDLGGAASMIAPGQSHTCAIMEQGSRLKCWGNNLFGQLGQNTRESSSAPRTAADVVIGPVDHVALGGNFTCATTTAGAIHCFGSNNHGQLGRGTLEDFGDALGEIPTYARAVELGAGRSAIQLVTGHSHACALLDDHSVKCWGEGDFGQLGLGDPEDRGDDEGEMGDALPRVDLGILTADVLIARSPVVTVLWPSPSLDPQSDPIHSGSTLAVGCGATPSTQTSQPIDDGSVRVRVHAGGPNGPVVVEGPAALTGSGMYSANVLGFGTLASGSYWIECVAADNQVPPAEGRATTQIIHDGGPDLEFLAPSVDQVVGQSSLLHIDVTIRPAPLGSVDPGAAVNSYELTVAGVVVPLVRSSTEPDRYLADVDLLSSQFLPAPVGAILISVTATNLRNATATLEQTVLVDGTGPVIVVQGDTHDNGDLIRGAQAMFVTLTDTPAGVDASGAFGRIGSFTFPFLRLTGDTYRGVFDSLRFNRTVSQLPVEIHALDLVGNETISIRTLQLDNQPPLVSLDPPMIREFKNGTPNNSQCSAPFDPVGSDSPSDGDIVPEGAELRARIEDMTNGLQGNTVLTYLALVDPNRVRVYLQDDLSAPILVDTDGDGLCDEVNDEVPPQLRDLRPIIPAGTSYYPASAATDGLEPLWDPVCETGIALVPPAPLCAATSPLTRVIKAQVLGTPLPAIYGMSAVNMVSCVGDAWDWRLQFPNGGPVCAVARAEDTLGNVGVSPPIRLCLQRSDGIGVDCQADTTWRSHDCLTGQYRENAATCAAPPDFESDYVREDNP